MAVLLLFAVGCSSHPAMPPPDRGSAMVQTGIPPTTWPRIRPNLANVPLHDETPIKQEPTLFDRSAAITRRDSQGDFYDIGYHVVGRVDSSDNYYDHSGAYVGRRNHDGSFFDRSGAYAGRIDVSGNVYDGRGDKIGQIDGGCDDTCEQDAVGRMLLAP